MYVMIKDCIMGKEFRRERKRSRAGERENEREI